MQNPFPVVPGPLAEPDAGDHDALADQAFAEAIDTIDAAASRLDELRRRMRD
jgi:hypothetical protein